MIGDSAYPESSTLFTPYKGVDLTLNQHSYNYNLSAQRMKVECAFALFKNKFGRFSNILHNGELTTGARYLITAAALHNLCIDFE